MTSSKEALRRQRRRELDARRSKSRVRLGSCLQTWGLLKDKLGFSLHSELAQYLLESYFSKMCAGCSGKGEKTALLTTAESLHQLILSVHNHGQQCSFPPTLQPGPHTVQIMDSQTQTGPTDPTRHAETEPCLIYSCEGGHLFSWFPAQRDGEEEREENKNTGDATRSGPKRPREKERELKRESVGEEASCTVRTRGCVEAHPVALCQKRASQRAEARGETPAVTVQNTTDSGKDKLSDKTSVKERESENETAALSAHTVQPSGKCSSKRTVPQMSSRGTKRSADEGGRTSGDTRTGGRGNNRQLIPNDDASQIGGKRKRKATPKEILPCEFDGCGKIFSSRQYLNHHMKYQHFQQKTFTCSHPSCGKSFNFKKHLKEHEKLHSNQRDYICEYCARAFRTSSNLIIHRRIHTGEKPLQCEVCGFTCRQKASLNWHMRKHNAESSYQFPCEICGRRFEKRDNVTAHRSKSHPDHPGSTELSPSPLTTPPDPTVDPPLK
ncbi:zinc finger protein 692 [Chanos chanos]|uniref:Zinc finger protein 692 n=1 Tax=Chanos chanos TaxID=29144 RepID=A0A6J2W4D0_CHACN|nr:zinc finger protein 692 [Chanos chanos]